MTETNTHTTAALARPFEDATACDGPGSLDPIPHFPDCVPLTPETYAALVSEVSRSEAPTSELSYLTLCCWHGARDVRLSRCGSDFAILLHEPRGDAILVAGPGSRLSTPAHLRALGSVYRLTRIPPRTAEMLALTPGARITLERDECDYVFDARLLAAYGGPEFSGKRKQARRFERNHRPTTEVMPLSSPGAHSLIAETFDRWLETKVDSQYLGSFEIERGGIREFPRAGEIAERCLVLAAYTTEGPVAVSVVEKMWSDTWTGVILKTDPRCPGATAFMRRYIANHLVESYGARWLNIQQDTGAPGLRKAKVSYRPDRLELKFGLEISAEESC